MTLKAHGELFVRYEKNPILTVEDWPYRAHAVFNPAVTMVDGTTLLLVRVEDHRGFSHLTVARSKNGINDGDIDNKPTLVGEPASYPEEIGIEDPHITYIDEMKKMGCSIYNFFRIRIP